MDKKEIEKKISCLLGSHLKDVDVRMVGRLAYIDLSYTDYLPEKLCRNQIEAMIPDSCVRVNERLYSDETVKDELMRMYDEGVMVCLSDGDGQFRTVPMYVAVEERLFKKCIKEDYDAGNNPLLGKK